MGKLSSDHENHRSTVHCQLGLEYLDTRQAAPGKTNRRYYLKLELVYRIIRRTH